MYLNKVNKLKKKILTLIIMLVILMCPLINIADSFNQSAHINTERATPTDIISRLSESDVGKASRNIKKAKKELAQFNEANRINAILESIDTGELSYRNIFKNTYIAGDSLMNGLEVYNILNPNNLCTQVSASLYHLSDNISKIIAAQPEILILHYGLNLMDNSKQQPGKFVNFYEELLLELKEGLPDTRIIVSSIFPVDTSKATATRFERIEEYNLALSKMCKKISVEFLNNTPAFKNASDYYGGDGIHFKKVFYESVWLRHIVKEKGIF